MSPHSGISSTFSSFFVVEGLGLALGGIIADGAVVVVDVVVGGVVVVDVVVGVVVGVVVVVGVSVHSSFKHE